MDFSGLPKKADKAVTRVNPADGSKTTVLTIADAYASDSQDGLLGMAFQPNFLKGSENSGVYLAYTYDPAAQALSNPAEVISGLPEQTQLSGSGVR